MTVSRQDAQAAAPVIDAALRADAAKLPALVGVDLGAQGYAVVRVIKVVPRTPPAPELAKQEQAQVGQSVSAAEDAAYYNLLKERFKAEILVPKPADAADALPVAAGR
jgi:peptidyl-prolyl cis-trans isomerase D